MNLPKLYCAHFLGNSQKIPPVIVATDSQIMNNKLAIRFRRDKSLVGAALAAIIAAKAAPTQIGHFVPP